MVHNSQIHTSPNKGKPDPFNQSELMRSFSGMILTPIHITLEFSQRFSDIMYANMQYFQIPFSKNENDQNLEDPFFETKKKCYPANLDHLTEEQRESVKDTVLQYSCTPITLKNIEGASFQDPILNNLIEDEDGNLMQLLNILTPTSTIPPKQKWMVATEYRLDGKLVARIFNHYKDIQRTLH